MRNGALGERFPNSCVARVGRSFVFSRLTESPQAAQANAHVESFHAKLRDECLNASWFANLFEARRKIAAWREEYNEERPHSALGYATPAAFARRMAALRSPADGLLNVEGQQAPSARPFGTKPGSESYEFRRFKRRMISCADCGGSSPSQDVAGQGRPSGSQAGLSPLPRFCRHGHEGPKDVASSSYESG